MPDAPAHRRLLLLGSNLAGPGRVHQALAALAELGKLTPLTPIQRMPARHAPDRPYYNMLAELASRDTRDALVARLKHVEGTLGRTRDGDDEVAIDIDLLATFTGAGWQPDPHALAKREFTQTPARELLAIAGIRMAGDEA